MGIFTFEIRIKTWVLAFALMATGSGYGQAENVTSPSLGEAFNAGAPEVEPVVVGRERWNEKPTNPSPETANPTGDKTNILKDSQNPQSTRIEELDPLETEQVKPDPSTLPLEPPKIKPATQIVRNFEGTLVFKPRKFGFAYDFPYQLENSSGKRLAFIDVNQLKALDPQQFVGQQINVMGKLELVEEGSDDRVIRARVIRASN